MPAQQENALAFNPNNLDLTRVAVLNRTISAGIERVWENVLDWEHLPHLHDTSFSYCDLIEGGEWGWRTWANPDETGHIELCVDRPASRYVARTYSAGHQISEIWTDLKPEGEQTEIEVAFWAPDVDPDRRERFGEAYLTLYQQLWDEDEAMMQERTRQLTARRSRASRVDLGPRAALTLPVTIEMMGNRFSIDTDGDQLRVDPLVCPHLLGPLSVDGDGNLHCPWHGYRFDAETGQCLSPPGATCRLPRKPVVTEQDGNIILADPNS